MVWESAGEVGALRTLLRLPILDPEPHPLTPSTLTLQSGVSQYPPRPGGGGKIKDAPGADHLAAPVADAGLAGEVGALVVAERQQQVRGVAQRAAAHLSNTTLRH